MERASQFNEGVICDSEECYHCGWDPEVAKTRSESIVIARRQKLYKVPFTGYCQIWACSPEEAAAKAEDIPQQFFAHYDYSDPICLEKEENNDLE